MPEFTWNRVLRSVLPLAWALAAGILSFASVRTLLTITDTDVVEELHAAEAVPLRPGQHLSALLELIRQDGSGPDTVTGIDAEPFGDAVLSGNVWEWNSDGGGRVHSLELHRTPADAEQRWRQLGTDSGQGTGRFGSSGWASMVVLHSQTGLSVVIETDGSQPNSVHQDAVRRVQSYQDPVDA